MESPRQKPNQRGRLTRPGLEISLTNISQWRMKKGAPIPSFFGSKSQVKFDDIVAHLFFVRKDVTAVGQLISSYAHSFEGSGFTGRVLILDGEEDQTFCGPGSVIGGPAICGSRIRQTIDLLPNSSYCYMAVDKAGHAVQFFDRTQAFYYVAHSFLAGANFAGGKPL